MMNWKMSFLWFKKSCPIGWNVTGSISKASDLARQHAPNNPEAGELTVPHFGCIPSSEHERQIRYSSFRPFSDVRFHFKAAVCCEMQPGIGSDPPTSRWLQTVSPADNVDDAHSDRRRNVVKLPLRRVQMLVPSSQMELG